MLKEKLNVKKQKRARGRVMSILLSLAISCSLLPCTVYADADPSCPGDCEHVASIGSTHYDTLEEAFQAADNYSHIDLLCDAVGAGLYLSSSQEDVTLDLNGHTYIAESPAYGNDEYLPQALHIEGDDFEIYSSADKGTITSSGSAIETLVEIYDDVEIYDTILDGTELPDDDAKVVNIFSGYLDIEDSEIYAGSHAYAINCAVKEGYYGPEIYLEDCSVEGIFLADGGEAYIDDGVVIDGHMQVFNGAYVVIYKDATVTCDQNYATIFVRDEDSYLCVKGEVINTYDDGKGEGQFAVATNGSDLTDKSIYIKDDAVVSSENDVAIYLPSGSLYIENGTITGGNNTGEGGGIYVGKNATLTLMQGIITENRTARTGSGVMVELNGTFTMNGGKITENEADDAGAVFTNGTFTMNGGEISKNTATKSCAGVYVQGDSSQKAEKDKYFTMNGGKIINNETQGKGGGVYADNYNIGVKLLGGEISGNTAGVIGGGVCCNTPITVGGDVKITNNTVNGKKNNIYLRVNEKSTYTPVINISNEKALKSGAIIGISTDGTQKNETVVINATSADEKFFFTDDDRTNLLYESGTLKFVPGCVVEFDANGGFCDIKSMKTDTNYQLPILPIPTLNDYLFDGWFMEDGTSVTLDTVYKGDTTIYAKWKFNPNPPIPQTPKSPHPIEVAHIENGTVERSVTSAKVNEEVHFTVTPESGYEVAKVYVTNRYSDKIPLKDLGNGEYSFKMPDVAVTIYAEFAPIDAPIEDEPIIEPEPVFDDVTKGDYFAGAVDWAVEKGITNGLSATAFGPDEACTRAQAVTFLWRMAGCPEVELSDKFTDVEKGSYYEMAVSWAIETGITLGTSETTFSPDMICNRGHIVTFLYRYADGVTESTKNPFRDVKAGDYYENPVLWAVEKEITTGKTATRFAPDDDCTRGQIVTFMWRLAAK